MQHQYKTHGDTRTRTTSHIARAQRERRDRQAQLILTAPDLNRGSAQSSAHSHSRRLTRGMDFILSPTLPIDGIPWEKVLPPLIPRLSGTYGQYNWSPKLLIPESEYSSSPEVTCDESGFTVQVDVKDFNPQDLLVKVTGDFVEVQGKHEEKKKNGPGVTTRQFNRRYRIPKGVDTLALESAVSPDGILIISAPMLQSQDSRILN